MNSIQLLIKIDEIKKQLQPDNTLEVTGQLSFKFSERGEIEVRQLPFLARNSTAESLVAGGVKAIYLASGRMRVYAAKPENANPNPNPRLLYLIDSVYHQTKRDQPNPKAVSPKAIAEQVVAASSLLEPLEPEPLNSVESATEVELIKETVKPEEKELSEIPF